MKIVTTYVGYFSGQILQFSLGDTRYTLRDSNINISRILLLPQFSWQQQEKRSTFWHFRKCHLSFIRQASTQMIFSTGKCFIRQSVNFKTMHLTFQENSMKNCVHIFHVFNLQTFARCGQLHLQPVTKPCDHICSCKLKIPCSKIENILNYGFHYHYYLSLRVGSICMEFAKCVLHCNTCLIPPRRSSTQFTAPGSGKLPQTAYFHYNVCIFFIVLCVF